MVNTFVTNSDLDRTMNMNRLLTTVLATGLTLTSTTAGALEHVVFVENKYMFPRTVYFQVGDTVRFQNNNTLVALIKDTDGNPITPNIGQNASTTIAITSNGDIVLAAPFFLSSGSSFTQPSGAKGMNLVEGIAPKFCPDPRLTSGVCP